MAGLKTIYSKQGKPLADIRGAVVRSSLLNEVGEATLIIPTNSSKCKLEYLQYGNYVVIQDENLPLWVGVIDLPRVWKKKYVEVHAYEAVHLMKSFYPPFRSSSNSTPAGKVRFLIDAANAIEPTIFSVGSTYDGGVVSDETFEDDVFTHLKKLAKNNGQDWSVTPTFTSGGLLEIKLNWHQKLGNNVGLVLTQGKNVEAGDSKLEEDGELVNFAEVILDETTNEEIGGVISEQYSEGMPYGVRMKRVVLTGQSSSAGLLTTAQEIVASKKNPAFAVPLIVNNSDSNTFNKIALGNLGIYKIPDAGFNSNGTIGYEAVIRIAGYRYDEAKKSCELFAENKGEA